MAPEMFIMYCHFFFLEIVKPIINFFKTNFSNCFISVDSKLSKSSPSRKIPHLLSKEDHDTRKAKLADIAMKNTRKAILADIATDIAMKNKKEKEPVVSDTVSKN